MICFASQSVRRKCAEMGGIMVSRKLNILGLISAAAVVSGVLVGCGGSGATVAGTSTTVTTTGGVTTTTGNSTTTVSSSTSPQQVQVTTSGGTVTATVPPGQPAISSSTTLAVIPSGTSFFNGLSGVVKPRGGGAGEVFISYDRNTWYDTGVLVGTNGTLSQNMVFAAPTTSAFSTPIFFKIQGPLNFTGSGTSGATLTVGQLILGFFIAADGKTSLPLTLALNLPANNGSTAGGNYANLSFPSEFAVGVGTLHINWPGVTKIQTKTAVRGLLSFSDPLSDTSDHIPAAGVDTVEFDMIGFTF